MKKSISKIIAITMALVLVFCSALPISAQSFSTNSLLTTAVGPTNWMSGIKDNTALSDITMPGTHDSGTKNVDLPIWSKTQTLSISEQLNIGIRYFDLRLEHVSDVYYNAQIVHGSSNCWNGKGGHLTLYEVLEDMYTFLSAHPSETLVVSVKQDYGDDINALAQDVNTLIDLKPNYWFTGSYTPQLGNVRGKCVLATRIREVGRGLDLSWGDQGSDGGAVDSGWMKVQDRYKMGASNKWSNAAKPMLDEKKPNGVWYVNFLSTTGGGIAGVESNASSMNGYFRTYEMMNNKCYGIVVLDYANEDLASKIYKANDLVAKTQPDNEKGQYYYRLNLNTWDDVPKSWQSVSCRLYYKSNNGTGQEKSVLLFDQTDAYKGYAFVAAITNNDFTGFVDGYPTKVQMTYNWTDNDGIGIDLRLYVGNGPDDNLTLIGKNTARYTGSVNTSHTLLTDTTTFPKIKSVAFAETSNLTVAVPAVDSTAVNQYTLRYSIYDQYGVKWQNNSASLSVDASYPGVSFSDNKLLIDKNANNIAPNTSFNIYAVYNSSNGVLKSSPRKITVNPNKIPYKFVNYNGDVLMSGEDYAGVIPQYTGETPKREPDENGHYTFSSWSSLAPLSVENNTYTAFFTTNHHLISRTVVQKAATCTEEGSATNYCTCGYSWTSVTPATGHNYIIVHKAPTCTEDGYDKEICRVDGDVKTNTVLPATGHDTVNVIRGEYVAATDGENGYTPFYCPVCNEEIVSMRKYDSINWSNFYDALGIVSGITADPDYSTYNKEYTDEFEAAVASARNIENDESQNHLQANIDEATKKINDAIKAFSSKVGVNYYTLTFVMNNGVSKKLTYKEGTVAKDISVPSNTPTVSTDSEHIIYRWGTVQPVTQNKTYVESSVTRPHTFNTFISPDIEHTGSCTDDVSVEHRCICGYSYVESNGKGAVHNWGEWVSNGNGTHTHTCQNDSSHTETDTCVINPETHSCVICSYKLNTDNYELYLGLSEKVLTSDSKKYSAEAVEAHRLVNEKAKADFAKADSQAKIDAICNDLSASLMEVMMNIRYYSVKFSYVIDDNTVVEVESVQKAFDSSVTLQIPSQALQNTSVEKWTVLVTDFGSLSRCAESVSSLTFSVSDNVEYIAYLFTDRAEQSTESKVTLYDNNGRASDIVYVKNGEYTVSVDGAVLTLSNDSATYVFTAKNIVFKRCSGFETDGALIESSLTVSSDIDITALYV